MAMTPLDQAHAEMMDNAEDDALRLKFYRRLADTTLFLLLEREPAQEGGPLDPEILASGDDEIDVGGPVEFEPLGQFLALDRHLQEPVTGVTGQAGGRL